MADGIAGDGVRTGAGDDVRIQSVDAIAVRLPMLRPMKMAGVLIEHADNLVVRITADNGHTGWGEAASAPTMTGELLPGMVAGAQHLRGLLLGRPFGDLAATTAPLHRALVHNASVHAAIDMALHDLLGRTRGVPVHALLGPQRRSRAAVLWMLGTGSLDGDVAEARAKAAAGCIAFKLKVGADAPAADAARTHAVRAALGPQLLLCADANQGWRFEQAAAYLDAVGDGVLDFLEQPLPGDDLTGMQRLAAQTRVPLGADEGIHDRRDIHDHHAQRAASGCSLKLIKLGGLRALHGAAGLCSSLGMQVNLACKVAESGIASAAVLQLAAVLPSLAWGLSLSSQYLADDLVRHPLQVAGGHVAVPDGPGLGVDVDPAQVDRYRIG